MKRFLITVGSVFGVIFLILSIVSTQVLGSWGLFLPRHRNDLDAFVESRRVANQTQGLAVGIFNKDGLQWDGQYGNRNDAEPMTDDSLILVASVSKTIVGTAAMQLWEQGAFELDDDINDYLGFEVRNPHNPGEPITILHLMTHRSTIVDRYPLYDEFYTLEEGGDSTWEIGPFLEEYLTPGGEFYSLENFTEKVPAEEFVYSNYGNTLLAVIVEEISGQPFSDYAQEHIFAPLGMTNSYFLLNDIPVGTKLAAPFYDGQFQAHYNLPDYPAGSLRTTVSDLSKFAAFYLDPVEHEAGILEPETVELMFGEYGESADLGEGQMGLVWVHFDGLLLSGIGHTGGDFGAEAFLSLYPDEGYGTIYMANDGSESAFITRSILKRLKAEGAALN